MNNVILMGRLTKEPILKYTQAGQAYARMTLAIDKDLSKEKRAEFESANKPTADFIQVVAWGRLAESICRFTTKGLRLLIAGRIQAGSFKDKNGNTVFTTDVLAQSAEFIDWKEHRDNSSNSQGQGFDDDFSADFDPTSDDGRIPF